MPLKLYLQRLYTWLAVNGRRIEMWVFIANLIGIPVFAILVWWFGWGSTGSEAGPNQCGSGRHTWDC
jgi:hypothetical protein